jgi:exodeoxyribonuclease V alpha subunit
VITPRGSRAGGRIHASKAQGSEYRAVVIPLLTQHYLLLQRNLFYTAVTRAKELVVVVGTKKAIAMAVRNDKIAQRNSRLTHRLARETATPVR